MMDSSRDLRTTHRLETAIPKTGMREQPIGTVRESGRRLKEKYLREVDGASIGLIPLTGWLTENRSTSL